MSDRSFGSISKDQTYENLNVRHTLGECNTRIVAKCIVADQVIANSVMAIEEEFPSLTVARASLSTTVVGAQSFDVVGFDLPSPSNTPGMYDATTGTFTILQSGTYAISAQVCANNFSGPFPMLFQFAVVLNGGGGDGGKSAHTVQAGALLETESIYWETELVAGDTLQVVLFFGGGAPTADILGPAAGQGTGITFASVRQLI
jgi:hypothetical protein